ncbi:hypothetical protein CXK86_20745 [Paenibacillus sp. BGI2013]|uniref:hypothetical protein n=1 Tax=Paenibacillus sp. BGI2013 TaxID=2058902 RepID=UPI000C6EE971|nr:hypothetical protein [Paenibacillus sp. BGI2013]PKQ89475.1 hypothetical protein CXK86_20745 [Paenibacillus sp. BGI2013]
MIKNEDEFNSLLSKRNSGEVTYGLELKSAIEKGCILEAFLKRMGHNADEIEGNWRMVDKDYAKKIIIYVLSKNMTHEIDLKTKPMANELSEYFLDQFQKEASFYTNAKFDSKSGYFKLYSWTTINNSQWHTFDTGIVAMDNIHIGILWATDPL